MEAFIADVTNPVQGELGGTLLQEDRLDLQSLLARLVVVESVAGELESTKVVYQARRREEIQRAESSFLRGFSGGEQREARTAPVPWGSSWFPWIEKTGSPTLMFSSV